MQTRNKLTDFVVGNSLHDNLRKPHHPSDHHGTTNYAIDNFLKYSVPAMVSFFH